MKTQKEKEKEASPRKKITEHAHMFLSARGGSGAGNKKGCPWTDDIHRKLGGNQGKVPQKDKWGSKQ